MSLSRRVLRVVGGTLSGLRLCNRMLVVPPTGHMLRGFCFERTPYKGLFYLWRVIMPLYIPPRRGVVLNYSDRLAGGDYVQLSYEDLEGSAGRVAKLISESVP